MTSLKDHKIVTKEEWIESRKDLLKKEKEFTNLRDQLSQQRRDLPGVEVNKEYVFEGFNGKQTLSELFDGRSQLLVYHFMFGPDWEAGCPGCSFWADNFNGIIVHLNHRDVTMMVISRVPFDKLSEYQKRMGGILNRYLPLIQISISITTFLLHKKNDQKKAFYNYVEQDTPSPDREGVSIFFKDQSGRIFYTYLAYERGVDILNTAYNYLDIVPKGRDENDHEFRQFWVRRHDEYNDSKLK